MKTYQITLRVPEDIYQRLIDLTKKKGRLKIQEIIREAINEYIERENGVVVYDTT